MSRSYQPSAELHDLVARLCDENLQVDAQERLNELLTDDLDAQRWYVEYMDLHASVRFKMQWLDDAEFTLMELQAALNVAETPADRRLTDDDQQTIVLPMPDAGQESPAQAPKQATWTAGPSKLQRRAGGAAAAALLVGILWTLYDRPVEQGRFAQAVTEDAVPEESAADMLGPAMMSGAVGARWAGDSLEMPEGQVFDNDQRLELVEGLAELTFRGGARVIVQGPAVIQIRDDASARMSVGRIAVVTPRGGPEFMIQTAAARMSSADGEFGADVDVDGSLATEVYRGDVELEIGRDAEAPTTFQLAGGQGARIDAASRRVTPLTQPYDLHFVRYLPQHELLVNLADVVAGGNGVRQAYHRGISLVDGRAVDGYGAPAQGDGRYIRTLQSEFVDGVFIPNGKLGPVQVDSIGRKFGGFPATSGDCWGGAIMARRPREEKSLPFIRLEYHGDNYGYVNWLHIAGNAEELSPDGHGLIGIHSNGGITFDLHAIRARYPNKKIVRFRARVGNLESKLERFVADAWVLVDGELRYRRQEFSRDDGAEAIDVPLSDRDRFLVLAVTDVGGNTAYDWVAFGDPLIELTGARDNSPEADLLRQTSEPGPAESASIPHDAARRGSGPLSLQSALSAALGITNRLESWGLVTSIWNHVERTNLHDMNSTASTTLCDRTPAAMRAHLTD